MESVSVHYPQFHDPGIQYERGQQVPWCLLVCKKLTPWVRRRGLPKRGQIPLGCKGTLRYTHVWAHVSIGACMDGNEVECYRPQRIRKLMHGGATGASQNSKAKGNGQAEGRAAAGKTIP